MLVAALVAAVALAVLQLVLTSHVRSTLTACASEGARVAAVARQGDDAGAGRAADCARASLGIEAEAVVRGDSVAGHPGVTVTLTGPAPAFALWHSGTVEVTARAIQEGERDAP